MTSDIRQNAQECINFIQMPSVLFVSPEYKNLSIQAKVLYSLMYDRSRLSAQNNWVDKNGRVYIYFTVKEITQSINCGHTTAVKLLDELDVKGGAGLIERQKQGFGKPSVIYVKKVMPFNDNKDETPDSEKQTSQPAQCQNTELCNTADRNLLCPDCRTHDVQNLEPNNNDINKNNINNNYINHIESYHITADTNIKDDVTDRIEEIKVYREIIKDNIDYEAAVCDFGEEWTEGIVELMVDVVCSKDTFIRINRHDYPKETVKERFLKIRYSHIENVYHTTKGISTAIGNIRAYMITTLYHSYETADIWIRTKVNYDMAKERG